MPPTYVDVREWETLIPPAGSPDSADWFDPEPYLGKRGHKYLSRGTKLWLSACSKLASLETECSRGISLGTNYGAHRTLRELHQVMLDEGAFALSPSAAPNFCINLIAGHAGIKYRSHRFNLTITTPQTAGLDALAFGAREIAAGRCDSVLAGAAEEAELGLSARHIEGAVASVLAPPGTKGSLGSLFGFVEFRLPRPDRLRASPGLAIDGIRNALERGGMTADRSYDHAVFVSDGANDRADMPALLDAAGLSVADARICQLAAGHATIEPLIELRRSMDEARRRNAPVLYAYSASRGDLRLIEVRAREVG